MDTADYESWMREAIELAAGAASIGEVPIGCVVVQRKTGRILGRGYNRRESDHDPIAHAEILALRQAAAAIGHWRLLDCALVVTLEPCPMCAGAIVNARIPLLVYGCDDPKAGAVRTLYRICDDERLNHRAEIVGGILADQCAQMLRDFFASHRSRPDDGG